MAASPKPIFLDGEEVEQYLLLKDLITCIETSFVQFSNKDDGLVQPQRLFLPVSDENFFLLKPAYSKPDKTIATKLLTLYPKNEKEHGLPALQSTVMIYNSENGALQAILDGIAVTDLRTAAASAVAVKHLSPNASTLAIIGTGHQAASHVKLMRELKDFKEIRVYGRTKERRDQFAERWNITACESAEECVKNADVVVTVTSSKTPVLFYKWLKQDALVCIVGAPEPHAREVDDDIMLKSQLITDSYEGANHCGDVILSGARVDGELGDVISGRLAPQFERLRVFKSNGMAIQDLVAGKIVVQNYKLAASSQ